MAETLGSLCDKLMIIKLKEWHSTRRRRLKDLSGQGKQIREEIENFIMDASSGRILPDRLMFNSNKVLPKGLKRTGPAGGFGELVSRLGLVNCRLWHEQEKVYMHKKIAAKENLLKKLALLNLERNDCIDLIDRRLYLLVKKRKK